MFGIHSLRLMIIAVNVVLIVQSTGWSQSTAPHPNLGKANRQNITCKIYSLQDLGTDPNLGQWIADTVPRVIQPGSWNSAQGGNASGTLSYFAPGKVLVIHHTGEVHLQVDAFLNKLKIALPQQPGQGIQANSQGMTLPSVVPAHFSSEKLKRESPQVNTCADYPVPAPLQQPKHLFHFLIRYEGDGVVDSAMTELVKKLNPESDKKEDKDSEKEKSVVERSQPSQLKQLFHFIIRYEGDGIIDASVVDFMKALTEYTESGDKYSSTTQVVPFGLPGPSGYVIPVPPSLAPGSLPFIPSTYPNSTSGTNIPRPPTAPARPMPMADEVPSPTIPPPPLPDDAYSRR